MQEALYRKYRPDSLKKLVGQPDAVALIEKQVKNNNLSHAYLFSGPRGVGKTSLARIIATTLGCDPVFDITEIDAASHNKVDEIRELKIPFGFKANLWKNEEPIPASEILNKINNDNVNNTFNPNQILGTREDFTDLKFFDFSKRMVDKGATILGGCCETKPSHIEKISVLKN